MLPAYPRSLLYARPLGGALSWLSLQVLWIVELTPLTLAVFTPPARYPSAAPDSPDPGSMPNIVSEAPRKAAEVLGIPSSSLDRRGAYEG